MTAILEREPRILPRKGVWWVNHWRATTDSTIRCFHCNKKLTVRVGESFFSCCPYRTKEEAEENAKASIADTIKRGFTPDTYVETIPL